MEFETRQDIYTKFKDIAYYIIIAVVSFLAAAFLPFIGSTISGEFRWPSSPMEWAIWIVSKLCVASINMILLYCFLAQAKVNVREDKNYIQARDILKKLEKYKHLAARSPKRYFGKVWGSKGIMIFVSSILSAIVLAEAILVFNLAVFLSYCFTVIMGVVMGYLQMRQAEDYWTSEYLAYAKDSAEKAALKEQEAAKASASLQRPQAKKKEEELEASSSTCEIIAKEDN